MEGKMTRRQHPIPEAERVQRIEDLLSVLKSSNVRIPISQRVSLLYTPTGTWIDALVASPEFTGQEEGNLVYVESGSQHGQLGLIDLPKEPATALFAHKQVDAYYDRNSVTREITEIYLKREDIIPASYFGTLADLLRNPNIARR